MKMMETRKWRIPVSAPGKREIRNLHFPINWNQADVINFLSQFRGAFSFASCHICGRIDVPMDHYNSCAGYTSQSIADDDNYWKA